MGERNPLDVLKPLLPVKAVGSYLRDADHGLAHFATINHPALPICGDAKIAAAIAHVLNTYGALVEALEKAEPILSREMRGIEQNEDAWASVYGALALAKGGANV